jgi:uncharacterized membrane protein AbrB (regulator of aidB expression)
MQKLLHFLINLIVIICVLVKAMMLLNVFYDQQNVENVDWRELLRFMFHDKSDGQLHQNSVQIIVVLLLTIFIVLMLLGKEVKLQNNQMSVPIHLQIVNHLSHEREKR